MGRGEFPEVGTLIPVLASTFVLAGGGDKEGQGSSLKFEHLLQRMSGEGCQLSTPLTCLTTRSVIVPRMYDPSVMLKRRKSEARAVEEKVVIRVSGEELASTMERVVTAQ